SRVGAFQGFEYYEYLANQQLNEQCKLTQIKLGRGQDSGVGWLNQAMHDGRPYTYLIAKSKTRRMREIMDKTLMTVYSEDNVNNLLMIRNMPMQMILIIQRRKSSSDLQLNNNNVMSLTQLQFP
ncbi:hypothetical protein PENTCL1PPCAC_3280, partial [Pristionchus entomophagus]